MNIVERYDKAKAEHPDCVVLVRCGDFYEALREDAHVLRDVLGIIETGRDDGSGVRVPMAGFPFMVRDWWGNRLADSGRKTHFEEVGEDPFVKEVRDTLKRCWWKYPDTGKWSAGVIVHPESGCILEGEFDLEKDDDGCCVIERTTREDMDDVQIKEFVAEYESERKV